MSKTINELINVILPYMDDEASRRAVIETALYGCPVLRRISWTGSAYTFTAELVRTLIQYGECEPGQSAIVLLLEALKEHSGLDKIQVLNRLIAQISRSFHLDPQLSRETLSDAQILNRIRILRDEKQACMEQLSGLTANQRSSYTFEGIAFQVGGAIFLMIFAMAVHPVLGIAVLVVVLFIGMSKLNPQANYTKTISHNALIKKVEEIDHELKNLYATSKKNP